jgi:hypothetical protein
MGGLVWIAKRDRTLVPARGTYDEMISTGRFLVIEDDQLRADVINYYSDLDGAGSFSDWIYDASSRLEEVLEPSGLNAFDYNYIEDPLPELRDLKGLAGVLRDIRRRSLRNVAFLEQAEKNAKELTEKINESLEID